MSYTIGDGMVALAVSGAIVGYLYVTRRSRQKRMEIKSSQNACKRSLRSINRRYASFIGWIQELARWRSCLAFPRILPNRICTAPASFSIAC